MRGFGKGVADGMLPGGPEQYPWKEGWVGLCGDGIVYGYLIGFCMVLDCGLHTPKY